MASNLERAKQLLEQIEKAYKRLGGENPFKKWDTDKLSDIDDSIKILESGLNDVNSQIRKINEDLDESYNAFKSIVQEIGKSTNGVKETTKGFNKFADVARKVRDHQEGINILSVKELENQRKKLDSSRANLRSNIQLLNEQKSQITEGKKWGELTNKERKQLDDINIARQLSQQILTGQNRQYQKLDKTLTNITAQEKQIQKDLGITGGVLKGISKIPILGDLIDADEAVKAMEEHLRSGGSRIEAMGKGFGALKNQIKNGALNPANLVLGAFTLIIQALQQTDKATGEMAKSLNITYSEALKVRREFTDIANATWDNAVSTRGLQESHMAINASIGARVNLEDESLVTMTKMREQAGLTNEEAIGLVTLSNQNNTTLDETNKKLLGAAKMYAVRNKTAINEKEILKDVSQSSDALKLSLGGSVENLAEAVIKTRKFGLNLKQAEDIASSLLDFESSIENELSAELLTGKSINLEKARGLALSGDAAGAAAEIAKQLGSAADFGKMNVIQQEALAKAAGMNREELAKSLLDKENLAKMGGKEGQSALERYNELKAQGLSQAQIQQQLGKDANADLYEQQSLQERFNQTVEKLKEIFMQVANALMPVFDIFADIFKIVGPLVGMLGKIVGFVIDWGKYLLPVIAAYKTYQYVSGLVLGIQTALNKEKFKESMLIDGNVVRAKGYHLIQKGTLLIDKLKNKEGKIAIFHQIRENTLGKKGLLSSIGAAAMKAVGSWSSIGPWGVAIGLAAAAGIAALGYSYMKDGVIGPGGETVVSGPKGSIQLDKDDSMIVGTDLGGKKKPSSSGGGATVNMEPTNALLRQLISAVNAGGTVTLDGQKVGEALKLGAHKTQ